MADIQHHTLRRVLRREIAGTIGLLTDEQDFRTMRSYRSFAFDDHTTYLQQVESLLRSLAAQGSHTTVALFDPVEYAEYCAESGLEPDTPSSRTRFTAHLAATGPTVPYDGQPLAELVPDLVDEAVRQATWEYATTLLARIGTCATCGEDIGRASFIRAAHLLTRVVDTAYPGSLHLVCSVSTAPDTLVAVLRVEERTDDAIRLDESEALEFTTVLALGIATRSAAWTRHAHHHPRHHRPHLRMATARREPRPPHRLRSVRRLLHRHRVRRPGLPGIRRRLRHTPDLGDTGKGTHHTH